LTLQTNRPNHDAIQCRAARRLSNWDQDEVALAARVSVVTARNFENNKSTPQRATLDVIHDRVAEAARQSAWHRPRERRRGTGAVFLTIARSGPKNRSAVGMDGSAEGHKPAWEPKRRVLHCRTPLTSHGKAANPLRPRGSSSMGADEGELAAAQA